MLQVKPIFVTDYAMVNVAGRDTQSALDAIFVGTQKFASPSAAFAHAEQANVGEVLSLEAVPEVESRYHTRMLALAWMAARPIARRVAEAVRKYGSQRVGLLIGTCTGGLEASERAFHARDQTIGFPAGYRFDDQHALHWIGAHLARYFGLACPAITISTACSSSAKALAAAMRMMRHGRLDAAIVGGADTLCATTINGFLRLGAMSPRVTQPFAKARDGMTLGEGAAFMLLDHERPMAPELALEMAGYGESSDAYHLSAPHPEGHGAFAAMAGALRDAGCGASEVDHVNAHGTGTPHNDSAESAAILRLLDPGVLVSSTKAVTGHLLGAAGVTEAIIACEALRRQMAPMTVTGPLDPACAVNVVVRPTAAPLRTVLSNSFGFGGSNASVLIRKGEG
jgi:3-oxoacyl-[acyl-carrier-protein] synthase I